MQKFIKWIVSGMVVGVADVIPGVSGGTMAVILGVFERLMSAISDFFKDIKGNLTFLFFFALGAGTGILLFSKLVKYALKNFPMITSFFFLGLILGSLPMMYKKCVSQKRSFSGLASFFVALLLMMVIVLWLPQADNSILIDARSVWGFLRLFLCSILAAAAMIIPGISGSFVLLLLGCYQTVISAVAALDVITLIPVALGCALGIIACAKILDKLFHAYPSQTYYALFGLILGSLFALYPGFSWDMNGLFSVIALAAAFLLALWFSKMEKTE